MRKHQLGIVAVFLVLSTGPVARADEAMDIINQAIKAVGGKDRLVKYKGEEWNCKGTMNFMGQKMEYTATYYYEDPMKFRFDMAMPLMGQKIEISAASDGKTAWEKSGPELRDMEKSKREEFIHTMYVMRLSQLRVFAVEPEGWKLTALGESMVNGKPALGVKVSKEGHRDVSLFFDKESKLFVKSSTRIMDEFVMKEVTQDVFAMDYKPKGDFLYFNKMVIHRDGKPFIEETFSDQKTVEKLDDKLFAKP